MSRPTNDNFRKRALKDPKVKQAYDALDEEFSLVAELIRARKSAGKSQAEIAQKMHTSASAVSRLESGSNTEHHSPSIATLRRYAEAVGCTLQVRLIPTDHQRHL